MSEQDRKKAWFVEGLRLLPDKLMAIQSHHLSSILASRRCREKSAGDLVVSSMHYRKHQDAIAWKKYKVEIIEELDAAVRIANEFAVELLSCRKLSIALTQGFYSDDSSFMVDAIAEANSVADKLQSDVDFDPWVLVKTGDMIHRQTAWRHAKNGRDYIQSASRGHYSIRRSHLNEYVPLSVAKQYLS